MSSARAVTALAFLVAAGCTKGRDTSLVWDSGVAIADADTTTIPGQDAEPTDGTVEPPPPPKPTWTADIQPIVQLACINCHARVPIAGAPMPLVTYADVTAMFASPRLGTTGPVHVYMAAAVADTVSPMPQGAPLTQPIIQLFQIWSANGAPYGDGPQPDGGFPDAEPLDAIEFPDVPAGDAPAPDAPPGPVDAAPDGGVGLDADAGMIVREAGVPDAAPDAGGFPDAEPTDLRPTIYTGPPINPIPQIGPVQVVQDGFGLLEGPIWIPNLGVLLFSDIVGNRIHQLVPPNTITVFRDPSNGANGHALDPQGRLVTCEHVSRSITRTSSAVGTSTVVETVAAFYNGLRFNSPNDIVVRSDGIMYFTDPPYGLVGPREIPFNGIFRAVETNGVYVVNAEFPVMPDGRPNGVVFLPDESILVVANTTEDHISQFEVTPTGSLVNVRRWIETAPQPDGMAVDTVGNIYVATAGGVEVYQIANPNTRWGAIPVPRQPSNLAWGDPDLRTLYITAQSGLYRVRVPYPGVRD